MTAQESPRASVEAIVIGGSAGALLHVKAILSALPPQPALPLLVVLHLRDDRKSLLADVLASATPLPVREAEDKEPLVNGHVYVAPPGYHMLVEDERSLALSLEPPEHYSRPSIDVLFDSAARVFGARLVGVLLSGASSDGAEGVLAIERAGGRAIVQDPDSASHRTMPEAALSLCPHAAVLAPPALELALARLATGEMSTVGEPYV